MKYRLTAVGLVLAFAAGAGADLITDIDNCMLWLDATDASTITTVSDGGVQRVVAWKDKSGFRHDFAQATTSNAPVRSADPVNGMASVLFEDGSSQWLTCEETLTPDAIDGGTWFAVFHMLTWNNGQTIISKGGVSNFTVILRGNSSDGSVGENNYSFLSKGILADSSSWTVPISEPTVLEVQYDGSKVDNWLSFFQNGDGKGTSSAIAPPLLPDDNAMTLGGSLWDGSMSRFMRGHILEVVFYDRVLTQDERNLVGYYLTDKYDTSNSYSQVTPPASKPLPSYLIPDDFENYVTGTTTDPNLTQLSTFWSSDGSLDVESTQVHTGAQALKAVGAAGSIITKQVRPLDYRGQNDKSIEIWLKGDPGNAAGDVTVRVRAAVPAGHDDLLVSATLSGATTLTEWTPLLIPVVVNQSAVEDPNTASWDRVQTLEIEVGAAATMYLDDVSFVITPAVPQLVLSWPFDEASGTTVADSSGNAIDGALLGDFTGDNWIADGGHTALPGDNALELGVPADPTTGGYLVQADSVILPEGIRNIFAGTGSWTMNMWLYLNEANAATIGGFGDGSATGTRRWLMDTGNGNITFDSLGATVATGVPYDVGSWQMITVTYDKWTSFARIYKNGELISSSVVILSDADPVVMIGAIANEAYPSFDGMVDDFRIWDGPLPAADSDEDPDNDVLSLWGSYLCDEANSPVADFNNDCLVDLADFAIIAGQWFDCTRVPDTFCQ